MKKIIISTLSLFFIIFTLSSCNKSNDEKLDKLNIESNVSFLNGNQIYLLNDQDFINSFNIDLQLLSIIKNSNVNENNRAVLIDEILNSQSETDLINLLNSYNIESTVFLNLIQLKKNSIENLLSNYSEFSSEVVFYEVMLWNIKQYRNENTPEITNSKIKLCLDAYNASVDICDASFAAAIAGAIAASLAGGPGAPLILTFAICASAVLHEACIRDAETTYNNCIK